MQGSLTTETYNFPRFRIFEIDADTNFPINHYNYFLNVTKYSNTSIQHEVPEFELAYDFLSEYEVGDMSFKTMHEIRNKFKTDINLLKKYIFHKY